MKCSDMSKNNLNYHSSLLKKTTKQKTINDIKRIDNLSYFLKTGKRKRSPEKDEWDSINAS